MIDKYKKRLSLLKLIIFKYSNELKISAFVCPSVRTKPTIGPTNPIPTIPPIIKNEVDTANPKLDAKQNQTAAANKAAINTNIRT